MIINQPTLNSGSLVALKLNNPRSSPNLIVAGFLILPLKSRLLYQRAGFIILSATFLNQSYSLCFGSSMTTFISFLLIISPSAVNGSYPHQASVPSLSLHPQHYKLGALQNRRQYLHIFERPFAPYHSVVQIHEVCVYTLQ